MKRLSFLPKAGARLEDISVWTAENFGPEQAETYLTALLEKCRAVAEGSAHTQSCRAIGHRPAPKLVGQSPFKLRQPCLIGGVDLIETVSTSCGEREDCLAQDLFEKAVGCYGAAKLLPKLRCVAVSGKHRRQTISVDN